MNSTAVLIFASLQQATNKFSSCRPKTARELFRRLTIRLLSACRKTFHEDVILVIPPEENHEFAKCGVPIISQAGQTFRDRLLESVAQVFQHGYDRILIVGNDCPQLNGRLLRQARDNFQSTEILLGPDHKGGLYLIGVTRETVAMLSDVRWNANTDFAELSKASRRKNIPFGILETCTDLDNPGDLQRVLYQPEIVCIPRLRGLLSDLGKYRPFASLFFSTGPLVFRALEHVQLVNQLPPPRLVILL
ncbi:MAG: DUF2064 domain-containing protein [Terriglobia bacterium]